MTSNIYAEDTLQSIVGNMADAPDTSSEGSPPPRKIDARSLRGLAHPLRMQILELLELDGPATATGLSERLGENSGNLSWHLRHLAEHGFIEEDSNRGTKRERWWQVVKGKQVIQADEFLFDPATRDSFGVYTRQHIHLNFQRVIDALEGELSSEWARASTVSDWINLRMTPAQLASLNADLSRVVEEHRRSAAAITDSESQPVIVQIQAFPRKQRDVS